MADRIIETEARRARVMRRAEEAFADQMRAAVYDDVPETPYGGQAGAQYLADLMVVRSSPTARPDLDRAGALERLGAVIPRIRRAVPATVSTDVAGLIGPDVPLPAFVQAGAVALSAPALAILDRLERAPLVPGTGRPWVPIMPPITPAPKITGAEKTELPSDEIDIPGSEVEPQPVGKTHNIAWQAYNTGRARDTLLTIYTAETFAGLAQHVLDELATTTTTATTIADAIGLLDAAGYPASLVVADRSDFYALTGVVPQSGPTYAGLDVALWTVAAPLVVCGPAVWLQLQRPETLRVTEPSIGGYGLAVVGQYVLGFPPAAVVKVGP